MASPSNLKGAVLREPISTPTRYNAQLQKLVDKMVAAAAKDIVALFTSPTAIESHVTTDASIASKARIVTNALTKKFTVMFNQAARPLSEAMVEETLVNSQTGIRRSMKEVSQRVSLKGSVAGAPSSKLRQVAKASVTENVALIKSIPQQYLGKVQQAVMRSITTGNGLQDLQPFLTKTIAEAEGLDLKDAGKQIDSMKRRAKNIALDQTRKAYNSVNAARMQQSGITQFEWIHTGGGQKPRQQHIEMSGNIYSFADLPVIDNNTGERGIPGQLPNCFPGSVKISLRNGCRTVWRYWYEGPLINLVVGGETIQCTPNHPILTGRGWLAAYEIQEGDYLASASGHGVDGVNDNVDQTETSFEDLFVALAGAGAVSVSLPSEFNFHGDLPESNVDTVRADDRLPMRLQPVSCEQVEKLALSFAQSCGLDAVARVRPEVFEASSAGSLRQDGAVLLTEPSHAGAIGLAPVAQDNAALGKDLRDGFPLASVLFGQGQDATACGVLFDDAVGLGLERSTTSNDGDYVPEPVTQSAGQAARANTVNGGQGVQANAVVNGLLRVSKKFNCVFSGHVYTIETYSGWYTLAATDVISKNCRCTMRPIVDLSFGETDE